ncbi:MAG: hypothetical protein SGILL_008428 [Bacillariaceae sp.]
MNDYVKTRGQLVVPIWKGLCELAELLVELRQPENDDEEDNDSANNWRDSIPSSLLPGAIQVLCDFLREGKQRLEASVVRGSGSNWSPNAASSIAFQGKLISFLAAKLSRLVWVYFVLGQNLDDERDLSETTSNDELMMECWRILFGLRGMATTLQLFDSARNKKAKASKGHDASAAPEILAPLRTLCEVAAKTGRCLHFVLLGTHDPVGAEQSEQPSKLLKSALESILLGGKEGAAQTAQISTENSGVSQFQSMSQALGRVSMLQSVLDASASILPENMETTLATIEDLLFSSIPQCLSACTLAAKNKYEGSRCLTLPSTFMFKPLESIFRILNEVDSSKTAQLDRLLIRWLSGPCSGENQHPITRELVLSLLHAYITGAQDGDTIGNNSHPVLVSYLSKILFDARSSPSLRSNTSALLIRLQTSSDGDVAELSRSLVENELGVSIKDCARKSSKKRKRKGNGNRAKLIVQDPQEVADVCLALAGKGLSSAVSQRSFPSALRQEIVRLHGSCSKENETAHDKLLVPFAERTAFVMAFLERCMLSGSKDCKADFHRQTGLDISDLVNVVLDCILNITFDPSDDDSVFRKKSILFSAAMRISATVCQVFGGHKSANVPFVSICSMVAKSVSKRFLPRTDGGLVASFRPAIGFGALKTLGLVGSVIPPDCETAVVQGVKKSFVRLLSSEDWSLTSYGITSLSRFGTTVDAAHKHILRPCLPDCCLELFQCRVSKKVWRDKHRGKTEKDSITIADHSEKQLQRFFGPRKRVGSGFFPEATSFSITNGSYVLEMTTQEGRTATVIFPPGVESLNDIEYMMGGAPSDTPVHTLKRIVTSSNGGATCLLQKCS